MAKLKAVKLLPIYVLLAGLTQLLSCTPSAPDKAQRGGLFSELLLSQQGKVADPNYVISLPEDHLPHPQFNLEWWYLTANLRDQNGLQFAYQWTLFRFNTGRSANNWDDGQTYMAHASLHTPDKHFFAERFARGGVGNAGVSSAPLRLFLDDWLWQADELQNVAALFPSTITSTIVNADPKDQAQRAEINLQLSSERPFVKHGQNGFSIKTASGSHASHYYSQPNIQVSGSAVINGFAHQLTGKGWFDHEWSSQLLDASVLGWDWFSLHLDDGAKIMAFRMRLIDENDYITGSYIQPNGTKIHLSSQQLSLVPQQETAIDGALYPLHWHLQLPDKKITLNIQAAKTKQINPGRFSYYEGAVSISGSHSGNGFMELTGY
jgi:predicted secreted hydrolase